MLVQVLNAIYDQWQIGFGYHQFARIQAHSGCFFALLTS